MARLGQWLAGWPPFGAAEPPTDVDDRVEAVVERVDELERRVDKLEETQQGEVGRGHPPR